ncbi:endo-1,4-beta-xylanase [Candidatus Bathyarchaeota archaeon]|nr:endo-1,4-beta-xylanase [Candidatus Bathyarchaeota archaeon]
MKTELLISLLLIASLITNLSAVSSREEMVRVELTFVDGFTGKPVDGSVWAGFWKADELWKENMFEGEVFRDYLEEVETVNGRVSIELPLHGAYYVWFWPKEGIEHPRYGWLPAYEPRYATFIFDGETNIRYTVITYPIGFIIADLYSPTGEKIEFEEWDDLWNYNLARFHGASSDNSIILFFRDFTAKGHHFMISVPAGVKSKIVWTTHVPGYGWAWLEADNRGEYYLLRRGEAVRINLVLETGWTMHRKAMERIYAFNKEGYKLSENVTLFMEKAKDLLEIANRLAPGDAAKLSWEALKYILLAEEQAIIDKSLQDIENYRIGELEVVVPDGYHVNVTLDYVDFFFFANPPNEEGMQYWLQIIRLFKYHQLYISFWDAKRNGLVPEDVVEGALDWIKERTRGMTKRVLFSGHATGPGYYVEAYLEGEEEYYPSFMLDFLKPVNKTAVLEFSTNWLTSVAPALKKMKDVEVVEYILEDELEYTNSYCWKEWRGRLLATPCTMEYKIEWMKNVSKALKQVSPDAKIFISTISAPANPVLNNTRERLDWRKYARYTSPEAIKYFLDNGVELDGINIQVHMGNIWSGMWDIISLYDTLQSYGKLGLPIGILEFRVVSGQSADNSYRPWRDEFSEENQAELMKRCLTVFLGNPQVIGIIYYTHWVDSGPSPWPFTPAGLLRADGTPKPAYYALLDFFKSRIYQGEIRLSDGRGSVKTLEGWYYVTISDEDGNVIGSYRIHVDGGSKTYFILHQYENQTLKAEVKKLREEMKKSRARISSLEGEIRRLEQDIHEKEALIVKLREQCSENITKTTTTTITTTLTETITLQTGAIPTLEMYLLIICIATLTIAITLAIAFRRR